MLKTYVLSGYLLKTKDKFHNARRQRGRLWPYVIAILFLLWVVFTLIQIQISYKDTNQELQQKVQTNTKSYQQLQKSLDDLQKTYKDRQDQIDQKLKDLQTKKETKARLASKVIKPQPVVAGSDVILAAVYSKFGYRPQLATLISCESGFSTTVISPHGDYGLFQVKASAHPEYPRATLLDMWGNINAAWDISNGGTNWGPWPNCGRTAGLL